SGQAGEGLVDRIEEMRNRHNRLSARIESAAAPDRRRMAAAFTAARRAHQQSLILSVLVALTALLVAAMISWRLIAGTVRSLQEVSAGFERVARGDFGREIQVS